MTEKSIAARGETKFTLTPSQKELIRKRIAPKASDDELALFFYTCEKRVLDPLLNQVYFVERRRRVAKGDDWKWESYHVIQTSIDGLRIIAERTKQLSGILSGPMRNTDGKLVGGWAEVYRKGWEKPVRIELDFDEYCQRDKDGNPVGQWKARPSYMIQKCAEAAALRRAFPEDLGNIYEPSEFDRDEAQVNRDALTATVQAAAITHEDETDGLKVESVSTESTEEKDKSLWRDIILNKKNDLKIDDKMFHGALTAIQVDATCDLANASMPTLKAVWERVKQYEAKKAKVKA